MLHTQLSILWFTLTRVYLCGSQAVSMNDSYLNDEDYSSVQSVEDIKRILSEAQTPGPNKYNFDNQVGNVTYWQHAQWYWKKN